MFDEDAAVPYAYKGDQWVSYDNVKSLTMKVGNTFMYHNVKYYQFLVIWDVQPPLDIDLPWSLGCYRKSAFGSHRGNYFTPGFVCSQHIFNLHSHSTLSLCIGSHLGREWSLGGSFLVPREIHVRTVYDSN